MRRDIDRHRAVEKDGHLRDATGPGEAADVIDQLLGPLDGERGNDDVAAARDASR